MGGSAGFFYHLHSGLSWILLLLLAAGAAAAAAAGARRPDAAGAAGDSDAEGAGAEKASGKAWRWLAAAGFAAAAIMVGSGIVLWFRGSRPAGAELSIVHIVFGLGALAHAIMAARPGQEPRRALRILATAAALGLGAFAVGMAG